MKKNLLGYIVMLSISFAFNACSDKVATNKFTIEREGIIEVNSIASLVQRYESDFWIRRSILAVFNVSEDTKDLDNIYEVTFPFKLTQLSVDGPHTFGLSINIDLCKNEKTNSDLLKETVLSINDTREPKIGNSYSLSLTLDELKNKGLVSEDEDKQEDVCLYFKESPILITSAISPQSSS